MRPLAKRFSRRGLLLVEAVLSAVVVTAGLVFISRGLSSQLQALRALEEHETLLVIAQSKLRELEARELFAHSLVPSDQAGTFDEPYRAYRWTIGVRPLNEPLDVTGKPLVKAVTLSVQRADRPSSSVQLSALWPAAWLPDEWR